MFEGDEYTTLMTQCKEGSQREGLMLDSSEELYKWFTQQVSEKTCCFVPSLFHVVNLRGTGILFESFCALPQNRLQWVNSSISLSIGHEQLACCFYYESIIRRIEESSCYISSLVQQVDFPNES